MIRPPQATVRSQLSQGRVPGGTVFLSSKPYAGRSIASQTHVQSFLPHSQGQQPLLIRRAYGTVRIAVSNLPFDADRRKTQPDETIRNGTRAGAESGIFGRRSPTPPPRRADRERTPDAGRRRQSPRSLSSRV